MKNACSACGSYDGVEMHHLYPKSMGCPDNLTVPLCHKCHGQTHSMRRRVNISEATKEGLKKAKARGVKLGNPNGAAPLRRAGKGNAAAVEAVKRSADAFAADVGPMVAALQADELSMNAIAARLNADGIRTPRGGRWHCQTVKRILERNNAP